MIPDRLFAKGSKYLSREFYFRMDTVPILIVLLVMLFFTQGYSEALQPDPVQTGLNISATPWHSIWFWAFCLVALILMSIFIYWFLIKKLRPQKTVDLENRLQTDIHKRILQAELIFDVGHRISGKLQTETLLPEITSTIRDSFQYYAVLFYMVDEEDQCLHLQSIAGEYAWAFPADFKISINEGMNGQAAQTGKSIFSNDVSKDPYYVCYNDVQTKSEFAVPIKISEKVIGVLDIHSEKQNAFDSSDVSAMETLANQIAVAFYNAQLYERAQKEIIERKLMETELTKYRDHLEDMIKRRTDELYQKNQQLVDEIKVRVQAEMRQEKLMTELERSNKELSKFAYVASHDLKSPLRGIGSLAGWLLKNYGKKLGTEGEEQIRLISARVRRMHSFVDGLLEYSKIGNFDAALKPVDLNAIVNHIVKDIKSKNKKITIDLENELPTVAGERKCLTQVMKDLIGNAVVHMDKPKGVVTIGSEEENGFWRFHVKDNGPGIDKKYHEKIFQIFQILESRDSRESTGIGLSIVKKIIERYGGEVWVESQVGVGSTFYFTLPQ